MELWKEKGSISGMMKIVIKDTVWPLIQMIVYKCESRIKLIIDENISLDLII